MIQKLLLNARMIWMIFMKILNNTILNNKKFDTDEKRKILIVFDDMIAYMLSNKKLHSIVTELFIRGRKLKISLVFITQSSLAVPKNTRLNGKHSVIKKLPKK